MAEASIKFNDKEAQKFWNKILKNSRFISERKQLFVKAVIVKHVMVDVEDHFEEQEGGPGKLWPEWSDSYLKSIKGILHFRKVGGKVIPFKGPDPKGLPRKGDAGGNILVDTGRLKNSFTANDWRRKDNGIEFFNNAKTSEGFPYAAAHNEGGKKMKQRRFMWLSRKGRENIMRDTLQFLTKDTK